MCVCVCVIDIYLDVVIVVIQEFRSSFRLLLQTTELLVGTVCPLFLLTCGRYVLFFDVVEKKLFSVHPVSENISPFIEQWFGYEDGTFLL